MDPLSQGVLGAVAAQTGAKKTNLAWAALWGALAGMAADLDVFIRSTHDPLLALEFHRHFTHSLFFIPIGGFICALMFYLLIGKRRNQSLKQIYIWSVAGYATHGLLDGCTSYGTQLLWPLSNARFSIDIVSVIDPLCTIPALIAVFIASIKRSKIAWAFAVIWFLSYLAAGAWQHQRAMQMGQSLAQSRGHQPERLEVKPSFANLIVWKSIYEADGIFYVDAVRPSFTNPIIWPGEQVQKFNQQRDLPWLNQSSQQAKDIERFKWFSNGFIAIDKNNPNRVVDMRYSLLPNEIEALWGIELSPNAGEREHVKFEQSHERSSEAVGVLWEMVLGENKLSSE